MLENPEQLYKQLSIKRHNSVWSWGVSTDRYVILQVWQDQGTKKDLGQLGFYVLRKDLASYKEDYFSNGYAERERHLEEIRQGKPAYLFVAIPKKELLPEREIDGVGNFLLVSDNKLIKAPSGDLCLTYYDRWDIRRFKETYP